MKKSSLKKIQEEIKKYQSEIDLAQDGLNQVFFELEELISECEDDDETANTVPGDNPPDNPPRP